VAVDLSGTKPPFVSPVEELIRSDGGTGGQAVKRSRCSTPRTVEGDQPAGRPCCGRGQAAPSAFSSLAMRV
jgi:hypothetical protein